MTTFIGMAVVDVQQWDQNNKRRRLPSSLMLTNEDALYGALLGWAALDREKLCEVVMEGIFKARLKVSGSNLCTFT